jgi:hypothetical protein
MSFDTSESDAEKPAVLYRWTARKVRPIILLYVAFVFLAFMAAALFVFDSMAAVKALIIAAGGSIFSLLPGVNTKIAYRLTESGLEKKPLNSKAQADFKSVFTWDQLSHVVPMRHGYKYYLPLNESNPLRRFWKAHISDAFSGEFHIEEQDREEIMRILTGHEIPLSKTEKRRLPQ